MGIFYSTNLMGPINEYWYQERKLQVGTVAAGRIDINGLDESEYYNGAHEYTLPPMSRESWEMLSDWLEDLETTELWGYDDLIREFERQCGKIDWVG